MIPAVVHAALVTLFTWLVHLLFMAIGIDLGNDVATGLAQVIVAYILSLFGLGVYNALTAKITFLHNDSYRPPFV
jgi:hypothetical protein